MPSEESTTAGCRSNFWRPTSKKKEGKKGSIGVPFDEKSFNFNSGSLSSYLGIRGICLPELPLDPSKHTPTWRSRGGNMCFSSFLLLTVKSSPFLYVKS